MKQSFLLPTNARLNPQTPSWTDAEAELPTDQENSILHPYCSRYCHSCLLGTCDCPYFPSRKASSTRAASFVRSSGRWSRQWAILIFHGISSDHGDPRFTSIRLNVLLRLCLDFSLFFVLTFVLRCVPRQPIGPRLIQRDCDNLPARVRALDTLGQAAKSLAQQVAVLAPLIVRREARRVCRLGDLALEDLLQGVGALAWGRVDVAHQMHLGQLVGMCDIGWLRVRFSDRGWR